MQNRIVLDLLTGSQGGVCAVIGQTCCTYIPNGMTNGGDIYQALQNLTDLQSYVLEQTPGADPLPDWMTGFFNGTWWQVLLKALVPVFVVMLLFLCFISCVIPCIRSMFEKMVQQSFVQMQLLSQRYEFVNPQPYAD